MRRPYFKIQKVTYLHNEKYLYAEIVIGFVVARLLSHIRYSHTPTDVFASSILPLFLSHATLRQSDDDNA